MDMVRERPVGPELEELRSRFDQWRQNRKRGCRIPKDLWDAAVGLTKDYSLPQLSRVLGLHYGQLRKRSQSSAMIQDSGDKAAAAPRFVELGATESRRKPSADCVVEFEDSRGGTVRLYFRKPGDVDFAAVSKAFWRNGT